MGKTLVIAEKPSVARDIARALGRFARRDGYLESDDILVSWAIGHLVELAEPQVYDPKWKTWRLADLPIIPERFRLAPVARTKRQLNVVKELLTRPDVERVINACDAGREGELIFRYLYEFAGATAPVQRLWLSALTDEAIREAWEALRDGRELDALGAAARCRSQGDWLVGMNATRGLTRRSNTLVSVGRVQTPTLAILVHREREIEAFRKTPYHELWATFDAGGGQTYRARWVDPDSGEERLTDRGRAGAVLERVRAARGAPATVESVESDERRRLPPLLHDLTDLQREMNRRYGFSARRTLSLAQELYEKDKAITYPRTDSRYLAGSLVPQVYRAMRHLAQGPDPDWRHWAGKLLEAEKLPFSGRILNDARVTDHHAIIPTPTPAPPALAGGSDKAKVYDAIVRRFIAVFYPALVTRHTKAVTEAGGERFVARGRTVLDPGWTAVTGDKPAPWPREGAAPGSGGSPAEAEEEEGALPPLEAGQRVELIDVLLEDKETKPPPRYSEAALLRLMETAGQLVDDEELQELMKAHGIGTPATRAAIIERLIEVGYVVRQGKTLVPTPKGKALIDVLPTPELASPALTGQWEKRLRDVEAGRLDAGAFMAELVEFTRRIVADIKAMPGDDLPAQMQNVAGTCPVCGRGEVRESPRAYGCSRWNDPDGPCKLTIWKTVAGRRLDPQTVQALIEGKTPFVRGFRSKAGKRFAAKLRLTPEGRVEFVFDAPARRSRRARPKSAS